jgi:hypothetical protein
MATVMTGVSDSLADLPVTAHPARANETASRHRTESCDRLRMPLKREFFSERADKQFSANPDGPGETEPHSLPCPQLIIYRPFQIHRTLPKPKQLQAGNQTTKSHPIPDRPKIFLRLSKEIWPPLNIRSNC